MLLPVLAWLSYAVIFLVDIRLYRLAGRRFPAKRRLLLPFLGSSMLWPILATIWSLAIGGSDSLAAHHKGYIQRQGLWYTFDTHHPVANFLYYHLNPIALPALLALIDVLILGTLICIPIYLVTLIRRWWVK